MSRTCFFNSLISADNLVNLDGSSFNAFGKKIAKSCEAKSFDNLVFKEVARRSVMEDRDMTVEEYVQYEIEKALRNGKVYNWETATYSKIWYDEDVHYLKIFKSEFLAIVYNDALVSKSDFSSEPTISPQHIDEINLKNETSLSKNDDEEYNVISFNDLFPFNVFSVIDLKLNTENDDDKVDIK
ncbi:hypothetical protein Tco_0428354 [Tanacetum coccineum]